MRGKFRPVSVIAGFLALLLLAPHAFAKAEIGQPAPALSGKGLDGKDFDLSTMKGKVVLVNFWATWCPPCRDEMPIFDDEYKRYHAKGLEIIAVSMDVPDRHDDVVKVAHQFSYPATAINDLKTDGFGNFYSIPVTFLIDRDGIVRKQITPDSDPMSADTFDAMLQALLAGKKIP